MSNKSSDNLEDLPLEYDFAEEDPKSLNRKYREFYGPGTEKYGIYPGVWSRKYGPAPLLGIVYADNEFLAERLAYDRGFNPSNCVPPRIRHLGQVRRVIQNQQ